MHGLVGGYASGVGFEISKPRGIPGIPSLLLLLVQEVSPQLPTPAAVAYHEFIFMNCNSLKL